MLIVIMSSSNDICISMYCIDQEAYTHCHNAFSMNNIKLNIYNYLVSILIFATTKFLVTLPLLLCCVCA